METHKWKPNNESYKYKCAKEIFKQWCETKQSDYNWSKFEIYNNKSICWRSNRSENAWLEYPIVVNKNKHINSIDMNWDEIWDGNVNSNFVPTYDECTKIGLNPVAVIDIVLTHKGSPTCFVEICHTNPVSKRKENILKKLINASNVEIDLIEIDAEWILKQTTIPSKLQIKRWLISKPVYDFGEIYNGSNFLSTR